MPRSPVLFLLLVACGGHAGRGDHVAATGGAPTRAPDGGATGDGGRGSGGEPETHAGGTSNEASVDAPRAEAGAASDQTAEEGPALIGSGTRYCESDRFCFGLTCYAPPRAADRVCIQGCEADADCGQEEICLQSAALTAGCYRRCDSPFYCYYGFDCFDFAMEQETLVCFPSPWAAQWERRE